MAAHLIRSLAHIAINATSIKSLITAIDITYNESYLGTAYYCGFAALSFLFKIISLQNLQFSANAH